MAYQFIYSTLFNKQLLLLKLRINKVYFDLEN